MLKMLRKLLVLLLVCWLLLLLLLLLWKIGKDRLGNGMNGRRMNMIIDDGAFSAMDRIPLGPNQG